MRLMKIFTGESEKRWIQKRRGKVYCCIHIIIWIVKRKTLNRVRNKYVDISKNWPINGKTINIKNVFNTIE